MTRGVGAVAVCVVLLVAGCNGLAADPTATATPVEPAPVPADPPPWLAAEGRVDADALLAAHTAGLRNGSVTLTERRVERFANGSLRFDRTTTTRRGATDRVHVVRTVAGTDPGAYGATAGRSERWANTSLGMAAVRDDDGVTFRPATGEPRLVGHERLRALFAALTPTIRERRDGTVLVGATRERVPEGLAEGPVGDGQNVEFEATVTAGGVVRSARLSYAATVDGAAVQVTERLRYEEGATVLERPTWVEAAVGDALGRELPAE